MDLSEQIKSPVKANKNIYRFGGGRADGTAKMKNLLGGKGANLAEMAGLGIPVPPGFTITTEICTEFLNLGRLPDHIKNEVKSSVSEVEKIVGKSFASTVNPLLLSVRSGARASMPGMMDTILNLGLNASTVEALASATNNPRFAWDSYRRFVQMYANVVMGYSSSHLEIHLEDLKHLKGVELDSELSVDDLKTLVSKYLSDIAMNTAQKFPEDPWDQLWGAIEAVFKSWQTPRAKTYRKLHDIPDTWGTAVNVQAMVFGNMGETSATGVAFTRNPSTGEKALYGEFLINAQGEDVVAGLRTPNPLSGAVSHSMESQLPAAFQEFVDIANKLETHYRDMQDLEFTIENSRLWMLQTRTGKRTAQASLRIACELLDEGIISEKEALLRIDPGSLDQLLHPTLDPKATKKLLAKGLPASPGAASGPIVFTSESAEEYEIHHGKKPILVRVETSPEDIGGMVAAAGILTSRGGMTSHAAVVARGMGKCCVAGCSDILIDERQKTLIVKGHKFTEFDVITLDGSTGEVFMGSVQTVEPLLSEHFDRVMKMADGARRMSVRANADTPKDAKVARDFGASGIGLCRTEHMFFDPERIDVVRQMILSETTDERIEALEKLLPMQEADFYEIFKVMDGLPVTIRLLDPPLHEFLPQSEKEAMELAERLQVKPEVLRNKVQQLHEFNPMLGHRGCRLAVTFPEIYEMQVRAIARAAIRNVKEGRTLSPEIMIPLILSSKELQIIRELVDAQMTQEMNQSGVKFEYLVGTMIELPRAALVADKIAEFADFFSFGTNDLTQTTLGISRDDVGRFLNSYLEKGLFEKDPFSSIDQGGVGQLVEIGFKRGRQTKNQLKVGVCGEHGGDPASIAFFEKVGLDYVSCSPFRVPIARIAAARATLK